ncbi:hypothetical protein, partial [Candidatus Flexifilum breve]|uniref:hypothetical protein n=1 Tax=Candidatus Flexifilum breve TaxID=3140694 RepID=UPI0031CCC10C
VDKPTLTFTSTDWNTAQTVTVTAVDDNVAEGHRTAARSRLRRAGAVTRGEHHTGERQHHRQR